MLKPSMLPAAFIVALCSCSKGEDGPTYSTAALPDSTLQLVSDTTESHADDAAQVPASEPTEPAEQAAMEAEPKRYEEQRHRRATDIRSLTVRRWEDFQAAMQRCVAVALTAREVCLAEGRDVFRSAKLDCGALPGRDRKECLKYAKLWEDTEADVPMTEAYEEQSAQRAVRREDAGPAEGGGGRANQQEGALGSLPESTAPN